MIIHEMEQGTPEWLAIRLGLPTASEFSKLVTGTGKKSTSLIPYANKLASQLKSGKDLDAWKGSKASERGHVMEPLARALYQFQTDYDVSQVGFITDSRKRYGCSPDSLVNEDGLLEIKSGEQAAHMKNIMYCMQYKEPPPEHVPQCVGQLHICRRKWVDLMFFHPDLPSLVIRITPPKGFIKLLTSQLIQVNLEKNKCLSTMIGMNELEIM